MTEEERISRLEKILDIDGGFTYSIEEWRRINTEFCKYFIGKADEFRGALEASATAYVLAVTSDQNLFPRKAEEIEFYADVERCVRVLVRKLPQVPAAYFWNLGHKVVLDEQHGPIDIVDVDLAEEQLDNLLSLLKIVGSGASSNKNNGFFIVKDENASKEKRVYLLNSILSAIKEHTTLNIPRGGGNENGPIARLIIKAADPILSLGRDKLASPQSVRKAIRKLVQRGNF